MKIAEALLLRADMQKKMASLNHRILLNSVIQEGDEPKESPDKLIEEAVHLLKEISELVSKIQKANSNNCTSDGQTILETLTKRDRLIHQHSLLKSAMKYTQKDRDRYGTREIKWITMLDIPKLHKESDRLSKKIRETNSKIQESNWKHELE